MLGKLVWTVMSIWNMNDVMCIDTKILLITILQRLNHVSIRFTSINGNPFFEAYMYIQANANEFDAKISALEYNSKKAREFAKKKRAAAWAMRRMNANK